MIKQYYAEVRIKHTKHTKQVYHYGYYYFFDFKIMDENKKPSIIVCGITEYFENSLFKSCRYDNYDLLRFK